MFGKATTFNDDFFGLWEEALEYAEEQAFIAQEQVFAEEQAAEAMSMAVAEYAIKDWDLEEGEIAEGVAEVAEKEDEYNEAYRIPQEVWFDIALYILNNE